VSTTATVVVTTTGKRLTGAGWGVWDNHLQQWLETGYGHPSDAWRVLLEVATNHPWDLAVAQADDDGRPIVATGTDGTGAGKCATCDGDGECFNCGHECSACDGTGEAS
jgi:hypothetical protein